LLLKNQNKAEERKFKKTRAGSRFLTDILFAPQAILIEEEKHEETFDFGSEEEDEKPEKTEKTDTEGGEETTTS